MQEEKITYRSEIVFCGKPRCRKCQQGIGHGPYWYAYRTVNGRRLKSYVGLRLPAGVVAPKATHIGRANQTPFVGRDTERSLLHTALVEAKDRSSGRNVAGQGQLLILTGDAGIGKTRLAEEVAHWAAERGWAVVWTRAYPQESNIPYRMWVESLRKVTTQGYRLRQEIARRPLVYQPLGTLLPELQELLPQDILKRAVPPEQEQLHLWEAIRAMVAAISESTPLLIVLDDLQWADSSSCALLAYIVRTLRDQAVMIIGTYREDELPANHSLHLLLSDLEREQAVQTLRIQPLTNEQIRVLTSHLPEPLVDDIQARAAGNPLFAEELARSVVTESVETGGTSKTMHLPTTIPDTISAILDLRLGRLSLACQRLLARAAVLGGSFEFTTIYAMEASGPGADEDTLLDLLEEALQASILTEEDRNTHITYHFWHPLLVSHLYNGLSASRRASLHRRTAEVLCQAYQGREEEEAATIVYHLERGGAESREVAHYAEMAGDRAYALSAYPEAERHYRLAAQRIGTLSADASTDLRLRLASILEHLGECLTIEGNYEEARRFYEQVLEVRSPQEIATSLEAQREAQYQAIVWSEIGWTWRYMGDTEQAWQCCGRGEQLLQQANVSAGPAWASLRYLQSSLHWRSGQYEEAQQAAHAALALFDQSQERATRRALRHQTRIGRTLAGDPVNHGRIYRLLAAVAVATGKYHQTLNYLNQALTIFEQEDQQREIAIVCANLGDLYLRMTEHTQAEVALQRALSIFEKIGDPANRSVSLGNLGILAARSGDLLKAESHYRQAIILAEHINDPSYISLWHSYLAAALCDQGKLQGAADMLRRALGVSRTARLADCAGFALGVLGSLRLAQVQAPEQAPADVRQHLLRRAKSALEHARAMEGLEAETDIEVQGTLAQVALQQGDLEGAYRQAMQALDEAHLSESARLIAQAYSLLGSVLAAQGRDEQAERYFSQALQIFRERGMRLEYARTLFNYSVVLRRQQDGQQELHALQEARQVFHESHAILDERLAEQTLSGRKL